MYCFYFFVTGGGGGSHGANVTAEDSLSIHPEDSRGQREQRPGEGNATARLSELISVSWRCRTPLLVTPGISAQGSRGHTGSEQQQQQQWAENLLRVFMGQDSTLM